MAYLGKYYACKIAGATQLALYRESKDKNYQNKAINELTNALCYWKKYTQLALQKNNNPLWTNRVGLIDWVQLTKEVENDIEIAKQNNNSFQNK